MSSGQLGSGRRPRPERLWQYQSAPSRLEWWAVIAFAAIGVIVNPILDLAQANPDQIAGVIDAAFCVTFVVAARWPWVALTAYAAVLVGSFPLQEQGAVLSAIALSSCVIIRVGSIRAIAVFAALLIGGLIVIVATDQPPNDGGSLVAILFLALLSGAVGAVLRVTLGRERRLQAELERRIQSEQEIRAEERQLISDELHDDIAHDLTVISTYISVLQREHDEGGDPDTRVLAMSVLGGTTRKVLDDLRLIMQQGTAIDGQASRTLTGAFDDARRELAGANLLVEIEGDPEDPRVSRLVGSTLSRTLREAVTNVLKHGGRSPVRIGLSIVDDIVRFQISNALPAEPVIQEPGRGTIRISERIQRLGGSCVVGPDAGTWVVSVHIPRHAAV